MSVATNDDDDRAGIRNIEPDPNGRAAMLLLETLLHGLIERSIISVGDAVEFVETAVDVGEEIAHDLVEIPDNLSKSIAVLRTIAASLQIDLSGRPLKVVD